MPWIHQASCAEALLLCQVYIVGPESQIDMMPSSKWLAEHTSRWTGFKTHLLINIKRDEALDIISAEGMLLVLCSMVDNMPYVVAEAAVRGILRPVHNLNTAHAPGVELHGRQHAPCGC